MVEGGKTLYIGGQNGVLPDGKLVGDDFASQIEQTYKNILEVLKTVGASQDNVVKLTIYVVKGQNIQDGYAVAQRVWGGFPTAVSVVTVDDVGSPGALLEIEAVAAIEA